MRSPPYPKCPENRTLSYLYMTRKRCESMRIQPARVLQRLHTKWVQEVKGFQDKSDSRYATSPMRKHAGKRRRGMIDAAIEPISPFSSSSVPFLFTAKYLPFTPP